MPDRPRFEDTRVEASRSVLVDVLTILAGDLKAIAIVGGWVPELVFPGEGHIGSLDVDVALDGRLIKPAAYNTIRDKLLNAGYCHSTRYLKRSRSSLSECQHSHSTRKFTKKKVNKNKHN